MPSSISAASSGAISRLRTAIGTCPANPTRWPKDSHWRWFRSRILGGRTNHYGRISLRFSDYDFQPEDGLSDPWPVTYDEMSPWYDKAEGFIGVTGTKEGLRTAPDGNFLPPIAPRVHETLIQKACQKLNIPVHPFAHGHAHQGRSTAAPPCHYCGQCGRGCQTASAFSSSQAMIFPAMKTGKLTVFNGAMARELVSDGSGKVTAVSYVDKATPQRKTGALPGSSGGGQRLRIGAAAAEFEVDAFSRRASPIPRAWWAATSPTPWATALSGYIPALADMPRHNSDGIGGMHVYVPWWLYGDKNKDFPRGYHIEMGGGFRMPQLGSFAGQCAQHEGYGKALKDKIREEYGAFVELLRARRNDPQSRRATARSTPSGVDAWGIPVLRFHFGWSDHEIKQVAHMERDLRIHHRDDGRQRAERRGSDPKKAISTGGMIIHEAGTVRMGKDPKTSALNQYCQAHDVKNLFVCDAAPFVSQPDKNVTLSIVAFAWRASEYLAEEMRKGNV